jgi:hypothetical protein
MERRERPRFRHAWQLPGDSGVELVPRFVEKPSERGECPVHHAPPDAIPPKGPLRLAHMAVCDHIRHPWASSTTRGVMIRGCNHCHPCSYTIVMSHRSVIDVESASKPAGTSIVQTGASANVSGGDTRITSAMVLTVGISFSIARKISLTDRASDRSRCAAPPEEAPSCRCAHVVYDQFAAPAVVPHKLGQRAPPVRAVVPVGPAERDDRRALDLGGDAEDRVEARLRRRCSVVRQLPSARARAASRRCCTPGSIEAPVGKPARPGARASSYTSLIACFTVGSRTTIKCQGWVSEPEGPWIAAVKT